MKPNEATMNETATDRPPAYLPDGKRNPEYHKWWRSTPKGKACVRSAQIKYDTSDKGKEAKRRFAQSDKGKAAAQKFRTSPKGQQARQEEMLKFPYGKMRCADCGSNFCAQSVRDRGWEIITRFKCICDICAI